MIRRPLLATNVVTSKQNPFGILISQPNNIRKWVVEKFYGISPGLLCISFQRHTGQNCAQLIHIYGSVRPKSPCGRCSLYCNMQSFIWWILQVIEQYIFHLTTTIHFLLERCLTLSSETTNPVSRDPWATIRERINTVFGEDLIDWSEAAKAPKTSSRSGH